MPDRKILNLGSGRLTSPDVIDVDCIAWPGVDVVCDITKGLPFGKEEINEVLCNYVLCQIQDRKEFKFLMNEVWRILKPGGLFKIKVPNARYPCAFNDPMDCRYFVRETFDYFNKDHYRYKAFNYGFKPWIIACIKRERGDRLYVEMMKPKEV